MAPENTIETLNGIAAIVGCTASCDINDTGLFHAAKGTAALVYFEGYLRKTDRNSKTYSEKNSAKKLKGKSN